MKDIVNTYVNRFLREKRRRNRQICTLLALAALVVFGVSWSLHYTGIALANEASCGQEEHTHTSECYEEQLVLTCGMEESEEHTHGVSCYSAESVLICGKEEHEHTTACYTSDSDEDGEETGTDGESTNGSDSTEGTSSGSAEGTGDATDTNGSESSGDDSTVDTGNSSASESVDETGAGADSEGVSAEGTDSDGENADSGNTGENAASDKEQNGLTEGETESNGNSGISLAAEGDSGTNETVTGTIDTSALSYVSGESIAVSPTGLAGTKDLTLTVKTGTVVTPGTEDVYDTKYYSYLTGQTLELSFTIDGGQPGDYAYRIYFYPMDQANVYDERFDKETSLLYGQSLKEQISLTYLTESNLTITAGTYQSYLNWDADAEAYYLEFVIDQAGTAGGTLRITYQSPTTPGGELVIFGAIYEYDETSKKIGALVSDTGTKDSREAFLAVWTTEKQEFEVSIENEDQKVDGLILSVDDEGNVYVSVTNNPDQPIIWNITMEKTVDSHEDEDIGEDLITGISVTDTITLPDGITWTGSDDGELITGVADENGEITFSDSNGKTLLTLDTAPKSAADRCLLQYDAESNSLIVTWEITNSATDTAGFVTSEISNSIWQVRLNGDYLTYSDADGSTFETADSHEITNTVHYDYHYAWSKDEESKSSASINISTSGSGVILNKTADRSGETVYMGEDAYYTISLYNQGTEAVKDLATLNDSDLSNEQYISPENIWKMFFPETAEEADSTSDSYDEYLAKDSGDYLTITITDAWVYYDTLQELETWTDIEGNADTVYKTVANYNESYGAKHYVKYSTNDGRKINAGATITITKYGEDQILVQFWDDTTDSSTLNKNTASVFCSFCASSAADLELKFNQIGYVVTSTATYSVEWDLQNVELGGGETRHYKVYSSLKNTFQYRENEYKNQANSYNVANDTVYLEYVNDGLDEEDEDYKESEEATAQYTSIYNDFYISKSMNSINGESVSSNDTIDALYEGSIVQYEIIVRHNGTGEAEDIPVIDYISSGQYLLIPMNDRNKESILNDDWKDAGWGAKYYSYSVFDEEYELTLNGDDEYI
ncbi:MAG: hypothetical protein LUH07_06860 [Lachnospiraceae bacterium]|nr:hypothetical protein [Lachnospiraceae bacterium]